MNRLSKIYYTHKARRVGLPTAELYMKYARQYLDRKDWTALLFLINGKPN